MIDDTSTVTPEPTPSSAEQAAKRGEQADRRAVPEKGSPQERTKNPKDDAPKWPGGGRKGENE